MIIKNFHPKFGSLDLSLDFLKIYPRLLCWLGQDGGDGVRGTHHPLGGHGMKCLRR